MLFPLIHKDKCYQSLVSFHNKTLVDGGNPEAEEIVTPRSVNRAVRRLNSAPAIQASNGLVDLTPTPSKDAEDSLGEGTNSTGPEDEDESSAPPMTTTSSISTISVESSRAQLKKRWSEIVGDKNSYEELAVEVSERYLLTFTRTNECISTNFCRL